MSRPVSREGGRANVAEGRGMEVPPDDVGKTHVYDEETARRGEHRDSPGVNSDTERRRCSLRACAGSAQAGVKHPSDAGECRRALCGGRLFGSSSCCLRPAASGSCAWKLYGYGQLFAK